MNSRKNPGDMTLEELLEAEKTRAPVTEEELIEQKVALGLAEARLSGSNVSTAVLNKS